MSEMPKSAPVVVVFDPDTGYASINGGPWARFPFPKLKNARALTDADGRAESAGGGDDDWICSDECALPGHAGECHLLFRRRATDPFICFGPQCDPGECGG